MKKRVFFTGVVLLLFVWVSCRGEGSRCVSLSPCLYEARVGDYVFDSVVVANALGSLTTNCSKIRKDSQIGRNPNRYINNQATDCLYHSPSLLQATAFIRIVQATQQYFGDSALWHAADSPIGYTGHSAVYDLKNMQLSVLIHQRPDEMKQWYTIGL